MSKRRKHSDEFKREAGVSNGRPTRRFLTKSERLQAQNQEIASVYTSIEASLWPPQHVRCSES